MLELALFPISEVVFGHPTRLAGETLQVDPVELRDLLQADDRLARVDVDLALPGTRTRVVHVLDVVEPRVKVTGGQDYFPGLAAPLYQAGSGRTNVLSGMTVIASGEVHDAMEAIVDMVGPAASFSKFSQTINLVLTFTPARGVDDVSFVKAVLDAKLKAAIYLAKTSLDRIPAEVVVRDWLRPGDTSSLLKIAYVNYLQSRGFGRERLIYGAPFDVPFPTPIHPTEGIDGAIVYNGHTHPGRNATYHHQVNGVVNELLARQGQDLWLAGIIIANHNTRYEHKERTALLAARMARQLLGADGVIISKDGGGQAEVDVMLCCTRCEEMGLPTVVLTKESGGTTGSMPLVHLSPYANAIVTAGSGGELITIDLAIDRLLGGDRLLDGQDALGRIEVPLSAVCGTSDSQGGHYLGTGVV